MRSALATLPWVEATSIHADREKRQVRFTVTDRAQFNFEQVKAALEKEGYESGAKVLTRAADAAAPPPPPG